MARGDLHGAPYWCAIVVWEWFRGEWRWCLGRLALAGWDVASPDDLALIPWRVGYGLLEALCVEWHSNGLTSPREVIDEIVAAAERAQARFGQPQRVRDAWGTSDRAKRGMAAALAATGGPARVLTPEERAARRSRGEIRPSGGTSEH